MSHTLHAARTGTGGSSASTSLRSGLLLTPSALFSPGQESMLILHMGPAANPRTGDRDPRGCSVACVAWAPLGDRACMLGLQQWLKNEPSKAEDKSVANLSPLRAPEAGAPRPNTFLGLCERSRAGSLPFTGHLHSMLHVCLNLSCFSSHVV